MAGYATIRAPSKEATMQIGKKLKEARNASNFTQEQVAESIHVSRQTVSNWENEKSYPDIVSVIALSDLYNISLDVLLKGDQVMIQHLEESTSVVKSNGKLLAALGVTMLLMVLVILLMTPLSQNEHLFVAIFSLIFIGVGTVMYQIIKNI